MTSLKVIVRQGYGDSYYAVSIVNEESPPPLVADFDKASPKTALLFLISKVYLSGRIDAEKYRVPITEDPSCKLNVPAYYAKSLHDAVINGPGWLTNLLGTSKEHLGRYITTTGTTEATYSTELTDQVRVVIVEEDENCSGKNHKPISTGVARSLLMRLRTFLMTARRDFEALHYTHQNQAHYLEFNDGDELHLQKDTQIGYEFQSNHRVYPYMFILEPGSLKEFYPDLDPSLGCWKEIPHDLSPIGQNGGITLKLPDKVGFPVNSELGYESNLLVVSRMELPLLERQELMKDIQSSLEKHPLSNPPILSGFRKITKEFSPDSSAMRPLAFQNNLGWPDDFIRSLNFINPSIIEAQLLIMAVERPH